MQSGAPTFGNPEGAKMVLAAGQLARRLGVPFHTVGTLSASKLPDAQSQQEATYGLIMSVLEIKKEEYLVFACALEVLLCHQVQLLMK